MFSQQFQKALATWTRTRPEYAALLKAIKAGKANEDLAELAADAGIAMGAVVELKNLRDAATAPHRQRRAAEHGRLQKELAALTAKVASVDKKKGLATTQLERDELGGQFYDLVDTRQKLQMQLADAQVAASCVDAATKAGVI